MSQQPGLKPAAPRTHPLGWGEEAPFFVAPTPVKEDFVFHTVGGRFIVVCFLGIASAPKSAAFVEALARAKLPSDDEQYALFGVTSDKQDWQSPRLHAAFPKNRIFLDGDGEISEIFGVGRRSPDGRVSLGQRWYVLDPNFRVYSSGSMDEVDDLVDLIRRLPEADLHATGDPNQWAPVLLVPRVLEPEFCEQLIEMYKAGSPEVSGFMRNKEGRTVRIHDSTFKRREDVTIAEPGMRKHLQAAVYQRLIPQIRKAFNYQVTRIERYIVANYSSKDHGFFRPHRDNTTAGTAHRRFAVSINLDAEEFEGGDLNFPEYGSQTYRPPTGGAVVFSCSLLHQATPVTKGERYATLPFLYDDEAAKIREANIHLLADGKGQYKA